jgi:hypothetical protein
MELVRSGLLTIPILLAPVAALSQEAIPSAEPKTLNFSVLHAQDRCDRSSDGGIVVCGKRRDPDRFRIPEALRHAEVVPRADEIQARLGPSALCQQAGNFTCSKAAIPIFTAKNGKFHIGPTSPDK